MNVLLLILLGPSVTYEAPSGARWAFDKTRPDRIAFRYHAPMKDGSGRRWRDKDDAAIWWPQWERFPQLVLNKREWRLEQFPLGDAWQPHYTTFVWPKY